MARAASKWEETHQLCHFSCPRAGPGQPGQGRLHIGAHGLFRTLAALVWLLLPTMGQRSRTASELPGKKINLAISLPLFLSS